MDIPEINDAQEKVDINSYFIEFVKSKPLLFFIYFLLLFLYPLHRVILPKYYGKVISNLKDNSKLSFNSDFVQNILMLLGIYVLIQVMYSVMYKVQGIFIPDFSEFSIQKIFTSLLSNKDLDYDNLETGEILSKIIKVPNIIYKYLDLLKSLLFSQIMVIASCLYHYFNVSNTTGFIFCFLVVGVLILQYISYELTLKIELKREQSKDSIYQHFQDVLNNLISVIVCKQEEHEKKVLHTVFEPYVEVFKRSLNMNFIIRIIFSLFNIFSFILLNYIIYKEYVKKTITKEHFISSFIVTYSVLGIFSESYYAVRSIIDMYSQVKDMEDYFNEQKETEDENTAKSNVNMGFNNGDIEINNVSYVYKGNETFKDETYSYALKDVSIKIKKNENVAIVGQIGSGKSTLIKLLMKLSKPTKGNIKINGINLQTISREELYDNIFYVPQKPKLLNRSLYENLIYGLEEKLGTNKSENINKINETMKKMKLSKNIIKIFNEKMDQPMGVDGVKLSGGQRQIVWIVRAMMRNTSILILDEPSASLDKENKKIILDTIKEVGKNKTVIIISHDNIDESFRKIELKQGKLVENNNNGNNMFSFMNFF